MLIHLKKQKHWKVNLWHLLALLVRQELAVERKVKNEHLNEAAIIMISNGIKYTYYNFENLVKLLKNKQ